MFLITNTGTLLPDLADSMRIPWASVYYEFPSNSLFRDDPYNFVTINIGQIKLCMLTT